MNYIINDIISAATQATDYWYDQRTMILKFIDSIMQEYPDDYKIEWLNGESIKIRIIIFKYNDEVYFWWDCVSNECIIDCSGLEKALGAPQNGEIQTRVLWCSDPEDKTPNIPKFPIKFQ